MRTLVGPPLRKPGVDTSVDPAGESAGATIPDLPLPLAELLKPVPDDPDGGSGLGRCGNWRHHDEPFPVQADVVAPARW